MEKYYIYDTGRSACYLDIDGNIHFHFALGNHCPKCNRTFFHIDFEDHVDSCKRKNVFDKFDMEWVVNYFPPAQLEFIYEFKKAKGGKYMYGNIDSITPPVGVRQTGVNN